MTLTFRRLWLLLLITVLLWPLRVLAQDTLSAAQVSITFLQARAESSGEVRVSALVSVVDNTGHPLSGLTAADFTVSENNIPISPDLLTVTPVDIPLSVVLLFDTSQPMAEPGPDGVRTIDAFKDAAIALVETLKDGDQVAIYEFNRQLQPRQDLTYDHNLAIDQGIIPLDAHNETAVCLNDALRNLLQQLVSRPDEPRLVVAFTGNSALSTGEPCGLTTVDDLLDITAGIDDIIPIYPVVLGDTSTAGDLVRLGRRSGGRAFLTADAAALPDLIANLSALLTRQYHLSYPSQSLPGLARLIIFENSTQQSDRRQVIIPAAIEPTPTAPSPFSIGLSIDQPAPDRITLQVNAPDEIILTETELFVDNRSVEKHTSPPFDRFDLDVNVLGSGKHLVRVDATAENGTTATAELELTLSLPPTPTPAPTPPPTTTEPAGILARFADFQNAAPVLAAVLIGIGILLLLLLLGLVGYLIFFRTRSGPSPAAVIPPPSVRAGASPSPPAVTLVDDGLPPSPPPPAAPYAEPIATIADDEALSPIASLAPTTPASVNQARLVVIAGRQLVSHPEFEISDVEVKIGRNTSKMKNNDIAIQDPEVSRSHARIFYQHHQYYLEDLGSTTGTQLNSVQLTPNQPAALQTGAEIAIGPRVKFRFEITGPLAPTGNETLIDIEIDEFVANFGKHIEQDPRQTLYD